MHGPAAAQQEVWEPVEMRARQLPAPLLQQAAAGGQAVTLPQTATLAERRAILGGLCLLMAAPLLLLVVLHRRPLGVRQTGRAACRDRVGTYGSSPGVVA